MSILGQVPSPFDTVLVENQNTRLSEGPFHASSIHFSVFPLSGEAAHQ